MVISVTKEYESAFIHQSKYRKGGQGLRGRWRVKDPLSKTRPPGEIRRKAWKGIRPKRKNKKIQAGGERR